MTTATNNAAARTTRYAHVARLAAARIGGGQWRVYSRISGDYITTLTRTDAGWVSSEGASGRYLRALVLEVAKAAAGPTTLRTVVDASVRIRTADARVFTSTPYSAEFISEAKDLGGRWQPATCEWAFNARFRSEVEELLAECYGWTAEGVEVADVLVTIGEYADGYTSIEGAGRTIVQRRAKTRRVQTGRDCAIVSGGFPSAGGSHKYPELGNRGPVTVKVVGYPVAKIEDLTDYCGVTVEVI